tara:strand:- start:441 stop:1115 length:675 start_codon:yes stop_codon:yes gene_type:complete
MKHLTKVNYNEIRNKASVLVGTNPAITDREVCEILGISDTGFKTIKQDREFHEKMEAQFEKGITRDLLLVDVAMIREAQGGNVQAARYLAERHGKFVKKYQIEVKSPYELFAKEVETADYEEIADGEEISVNQDELPPRDERNNKPLTRVKKENKQLHKTLQRIKKENSPQYRSDRSDRYQLRKRAKAVGLEPMGRGKPTKNKRDKWFDELLRLEEAQRVDITL